MAPLKLYVLPKILHASLGHELRTSLFFSSVSFESIWADCVEENLAPGLDDRATTNGER